MIEQFRDIISYGRLIVVILKMLVSNYLYMSHLILILSILIYIINIFKKKKNFFLKKKKKK